MMLFWHYSMYGNVDKVLSEILDYELITNHNLRWNNVNQSGLLLNTSRFPSSATDLSLLNKTPENPFWVSLLKLVHIVTHQSGNDSVHLLNSLLVAALHYGRISCYWWGNRRTVQTWHRPFDSDEVKPVSDRRYGESTLRTSSHRCVGIPPCDFTSLRTQQYQKQQKHDAELDVQVTHCETLHTIIMSEADDQVGIYSQKKKNKCPWTLLVFIFKKTPLTLLDRLKIPHLPQIELISCQDEDK